MPRATRNRPEFEPDQLVVAWDSASIGSLPGAPVVQRGTRLRGDSELVRAAPWLFIKDGGDSHETERKIRQRFADELVNAYQPPPRPPPPPPSLRDEDALVAIRSVGGLETPVVAGQRVPRDHPAVKRNRRAFVEVVPPGLSRDQALVAQTTMRNITDDGERVVHAGQWVHQDDPLVQAHPHQFAAPPEPES